MKTTKLILAVLMIASMFMLGAASSVPAADTIKIGEIQTYSKLTNFTFPYRNGWQLALEEINNSGGVLGKQIEVISRDDAGKFLGFYVEHGILPKDPFVSIDTSGVGQLVQMGTERGREGRKGLKVGICGEHGGDPDSIAFCNIVGLDYVSCSPFRVPIARLAAAQATILQDPKSKVNVKKDK